MKIGDFAIITKSHNAKFITNIFDGVRNGFALKPYTIKIVALRGDVEMSPLRILARESNEFHTYKQNIHMTKPFPTRAKIIKNVYINAK